MNDDEQADLLGQTRPQKLKTIVAVPRLRFRIVREGGAPADRELTVDGDCIRIGSHPSNEVVLDDRHVSRFHCTVELARSNWRINDAGSLNGTAISGLRVRDADLPAGGCNIVLGQSELHVAAASPASMLRVPEISQFGELYGESLAMRQVFSVLERAAQSDATVLVLGPSGTGKELVAHELVRRGPRANAPFITVDASAISPNLIESELFGHVKGAFTGADRARIGAFEAAHGGTLFLDEIGEMPVEMQPKLLRALEAREIRRVGENDTRKVNVRVIAATNRSLEREVNRGRFREDLFFRLSVISVRLPALRERPEDIPILVRAFLERMGTPDGAHLFTPEVLRDLAEHDWPGNVRELRNYVERALVLADTAIPASAGGPLVAREGDGDTSDPASGGSGVDEPFKTAKERVIEHFERRYLAELMTWAAGNVSRAARKARIDRMYLHRLLSRYSLGRESTGVPDIPRSRLDGLKT